MRVWRSPPPDFCSACAQQFTALDLYKLGSKYEPGMTYKHVHEELQPSSENICASANTSRALTVVCAAETVQGRAW